MSTVTTRLRVLISDDDPMIRDALREVLDSEPDIDVVASAVNGAEAVDVAAELRPDVILMDLHMPVMDGGVLVGVVSIGDVVKHRIRELEIDRNTLEQYVTG